MSSQFVAANLPTSRHAYIPKVVDLDFPSYLCKDDLVQDVVQHLRISGACVVRRMFSQQTMMAIEGEIRPYIEAARDDDEATREDVVFMPPTATATATKVPDLETKSYTYASSVTENKIWQGVSEYFLASQSTNTQVSQPHTHAYIWQ